MRSNGGEVGSGVGSKKEMKEERQREKRDHLSGT